MRQDGLRGKGVDNVTPAEICIAELRESLYWTEDQARKMPDADRKAYLENKSKALRWGVKQLTPETPAESETK